MAVRTKATNSATALDTVPRLLPISDTVNGKRARESPREVIAHYERLADRLWLPPQLEAFSTTVLESIGGGKSALGESYRAVRIWEDCSGYPPLAPRTRGRFSGNPAAFLHELRRVCRWCFCLGGGPGPERQGAGEEVV